MRDENRNRFKFINNMAKYSNDVLTHTCCSCFIYLWCFKRQPLQSHPSHRPNPDNKNKSCIKNKLIIKVHAADWTNPIFFHSVTNNVFHPLRWVPGSWLSVSHPILTQLQAICKKIKQKICGRLWVGVLPKNIKLQFVRQTQIGFTPPPVLDQFEPVALLLVPPAAQYHAIHHLDINLSIYLGYSCCPWSPPSVLSLHLTIFSLLPLSIPLAVSVSSHVLISSMMDLTTALSFTLFLSMQFFKTGHCPVDRLHELFQVLLQDSLL